MVTSKLFLIVSLTWVLLLGETFLFFEVIRPLAPNIHESVFSASLKVTATILLFVLWAAAMFAMERYYVRSTRPHQPRVVGP